MKEDKTIKYMVYQILLNHPAAREDDRVFENRCITYEQQRNDYIAYELGILQGKFSKIGTLLATKRQLQRDYEFLRGKNWPQNRKKKKNLDNPKITQINTTYLKK